jgi:phasin family protein
MTTAKESIEMMNELNTKGYEAVQSLGEINLRVMERLLARQMDAFSMAMDSGLRQMKMVSEAKGPSDLVKGQLDLVRELSERMMTESRENVRIATDARNEYRAWFEQGMQAINEKMTHLRPAAA